jgi:Glycosyltransferase family 87
MGTRAIAILRPLAWPLIIASLAALAFTVHIYEEMVDFDVYRRAAVRAVDAQELYRPDDGHYQFKYLPLFAFAMRPFAHMDLEMGRVVWFAMSVSLLVVFMRWTVRGLPERRLTEKALIWFAVIFVAKFYVRELNLGQSNILLATILMGALLAEQIDARTVAGVLVGVGVFVKPYAVILAPWLWLVGGLPALAGFGITVIAGLLLPAIAYGWQGNLHEIIGWYRTVTDTVVPNLLNPENVSTSALWTKRLGLEQADLAMKLGHATNLVAVAVAAWVMSMRRRATEPGYLEFGMLMLLVPILSPQGWDYVLLLGTPAVVVLVDRWKEMSRPWQAVTAVGIFGMSFTIFDLIGRTLYTAAMRYSVVTISVLMLLGALAYLRRRGLA